MNLANDPALDQQLCRLRKSYPVFRIESASAVAEGGTARLTFRFSSGDRTFEPEVRFTGLSAAEAARVEDPAARRIVRAIGIVEACSYWKAFCSPCVEIGIGDADKAELGWWEPFWRKSMGEFYFRNGLDFTAPGFLSIRNAPDLPAAKPALPAPMTSATRPLVMFSGGKDSLALAYALKQGPADFFLYNPTGSQKTLAESLRDGGNVTEVYRKILPQLLEMNATGDFLNGHTPYSAYLALCAMLVGYLRGNDIVVAGNSRSDDEPNIDSFHGAAINHQWTKSSEFEAALQEYGARWLPGAPGYCSPLRPLYELQIIRTLADRKEAFFTSQSCNKTKSQGWCGKCAKCSWVFLATASLFGHETAVAKIGSDLFSDPELSGLYAAMAGITPGVPKPFECTGTEIEVRSAIAACGQQGGSTPALDECLGNPEVASARPLDAVIKDWGQDDLMPPNLRTLVHRAAAI